MKAYVFSVVVPFFSKSRRGVASPFANDLEEYGKVEMMPVLEGKRMTIMLTPPSCPAKKDDSKKEGKKPEARESAAERRPNNKKRETPLIIR